MGWVVNATPRPLSPEKDPILTVTKAIATFTHRFFHGFGAYAPSVHAESVSVNAQPAETPGARSLPTGPACRSELAWHSHGHSNTSVETLFSFKQSRCEECLAVSVEVC
jgi:hypothetical protein